jgi:hypothetical protein
LPSRGRIHSTITAMTAPIRMPSSAFLKNSRTPPARPVCSPLTAATAIANRVSAVASLTRLSPVSVEVMRLGSPSSSPCETIVMVSGGASTAPSTKQAATPIDGRIQVEITPSAPVVSSTSVMPSVVIELRLAPNAANDAPRVAE